jgi:succinoglycan biosynthesis protein ExoL
VGAAWGRRLVQIIFFGHDAYDPAIQRRIAGLENAGASVQAFTMRRGEAFTTPWRNFDLGETRDAAFAQRFVALARAAPMLSKHRDALRRADVFYARNLDMLALASWAKSTTGARASLIYECLDVHRFMTRNDPLGVAMRSTERALLKNVSLVVVSSLAFAGQYFDRVHPGLAKTMLVENRLPWGFDYGPRPTLTVRASGPIRIGWFGVLRCRRSLNLLLDLADRFPNDIALSFRGIPARKELQDFEDKIAGRANVRFGGRYKWPDDLASIYNDVDLVWAGDFHDPGANSRWLMPNRLYEGGYYATPPLAPLDSETGHWIEAHAFGFTRAEPLEQTLPALIAVMNRDKIQAARARLLAASDALFLQPRDEMASVLAAAMERP